MLLKNVTYYSNVHWAKELLISNVDAEFQKCFFELNLITLRYPQHCQSVSLVDFFCFLYERDKIMIWVYKWYFFVFARHELVQMNHF